MNVIRDNPDNVDTLKMAIKRLAILIDPLRSKKVIQNLAASLDANAPQILVSTLNNITNDTELDEAGCSCLKFISMLARGKVACFIANAEKLLVSVIERNTNNYNSKNKAIENAINTLRLMVTEKDRFKVMPQHINALRTAGVAAALINARVKNIDLDKSKYITNLLELLDYDDNGANRRVPVQAQPLTLLNRIQFWKKHGGRRKTVKVRKAITRRR